jgi:hypothetical protein
MFQRHFIMARTLDGHGVPESAESGSRPEQCVWTGIDWRGKQCADGHRLCALEPCVRSNTKCAPTHDACCSLGRDSARSGRMHQLLWLQ